MMSRALLDVQNIHFSYGATSILNGVSFAAEPGAYICLVGPNGSGKTTLFNIISGFLSPCSGFVHYEGTDIRRIPVHERAKNIALVSQNQRMDFPFTCLEIVLMGLHPHRARFEPVRDEHLQFAEQIMRQTDTWQFANKPVTQLSGGELQRVILARALIQKPKVLLLDEAMSELDIAARLSMMKLLKAWIRKTNMTVVGIHHDLHLVYQYADRVIALSNGAVAADGPTQEVFTESFFQDVFFVKVQIQRDLGFIIQDTISLGTAQKGRSQ